MGSITPGIRRSAGAVLFVLLVGPAPKGGVIVAQTIERTDTPKRGYLRVTFDPRIFVWDRQFTNDGLESLGAPLTGDTVGAQHIPIVTRLQQDVRTASGLPGFIASLGRGALSIHKEERVTPVTAEMGITNRLSLAVTVPIVRVAIRSAFSLSAAGANLGPNPLATAAGASQRYSDFFTHFNSALGQLNDSLSSGGHYGCPSSPRCAQGQALLARSVAVRDALERTVYGVGSTGSPFVPREGTDAGLGIDSTLAQLQRQIDSGYSVPGFHDTFLLATDTLSGALFAAFLNDSIYGFGYRPLRDTWRYGLGDVEVEAKYRIVSGTRYVAALAGLVRLPTGARDSTLEVADISIADHQTDFEGRIIQEVTLAGRLWLNLAIRAGTQRPGTKARRVAGPDDFLVPLQATTVLNWDPGDYAAIDFAPLYRVTPQFGLGVTAGYWSKARDHYSYRTVQDSIDLVRRVGTATPASVLDQGTAERWLRLGVAVTYATPTIEGGFTVDQTVSGAGGQVPAATVYRIVVRVARRLF